MIFKTLDKLERCKAYAPIGIRLVFFLYLILAIRSEVYLPSVVQKFAENLEGLGLPIPLFLAYLGSWSLFIAYIMIVIGWKVRLAAIPVIIYFIVAILAFHIPNGQAISKAMPATVLLVMGCFLLLNGGGKPSIDEGL